MYTVVTHRRVQPTGRLSAGNFKFLSKEVDYCLKNAIRVVVLELDRVDFVDSLGLGLLISSYKKLKKQGVQVYVCAPQEQVTMLFDLADINVLFDVYSSYDHFYKKVVQPNQWILVK